MSYQTITNAATGSSFIVFAKGMGLLFAMRAWVETSGANGAADTAPRTDVCLRFRAEAEPSEAGSFHVAKVCENMLPSVKWGNGDASYRSAVAQFTISASINGSALVTYLSQQGALTHLYKAWVKALSEVPEIKVVLTEAEFVNAITTTMEGKAPADQNIMAKVPFTKALIEQVVNDADETVPLDPAALKAVGLN